MASRTATPLTLTEEQVLCFRARRGHLTGTGAPDAATAARDVLGAQSQQLPPSLWALSLRTAHRPTAAELQDALLEAPRTLVRTWGQRETLHVYDPADWATFVAARTQWSPGPRGGPMPTDAMLDDAREAMAAAGRPVTRTDLLPIVPKTYVKQLRDEVAAIRLEAIGTAERFAAARLLWRLNMRGDACVAGKAGAEQAYALRSDWFPELRWPERAPSGARVATDLARRYLALHGPATAKDVAHFFAARVRTARTWLDALDEASELVSVACGDRRDLVALACDADVLAERPAKGAAAWPVRLAPLWDTLLMAHADKRWSVPDPAEEKLVWRKAGYVSAVVLVRGRVVATWTHTKQARRVLVDVLPLSGWRKTHLAGVRREARDLAAHLGVADADVTVNG